MLLINHTLEQKINLAAAWKICKQVYSKKDQRTHGTGFVSMIFGPKFIVWQLNALEMRIFEYNKQTDCTSVLRMVYC